MSRGACIVRFTVLQEEGLEIQVLARQLDEAEEVLLRTTATVVSRQTATKAARPNHASAQAKEARTNSLSVGGVFHR